MTSSRKAPTAAEQGAAPDRLQLRSLRSFLAPVSALPAAGDLGRSAVARGLDVYATIVFAVEIISELRS